MLPRLTELCVNQVGQFHLSLDNVAALLELADQYNLVSLTTLCASFLVLNYFAVLASGLLFKLPASYCWQMQQYIDSETARTCTTEPAWRTESIVPLFDIISNGTVSPKKSPKKRSKKKLSSQSLDESVNKDEAPSSEDSIPQQEIALSVGEVPVPTSNKGTQLPSKQSPVKIVSVTKEIPIPNANPRGNTRTQESATFSLADFLEAQQSPKKRKSNEKAPSSKVDSQKSPSWKPVQPERLSLSTILQEQQQNAQASRGFGAWANKPGHSTTLNKPASQSLAFIMDEADALAQLQEYLDREKAEQEAQAQLPQELQQTPQTPQTPQTLTQAADPNSAGRPLKFKVTFKGSPKSS